VLLDDVLSELDERRGEALVSHIGEHGQALVTSTVAAHAGMVPSEGSAVFFVEAGEVVRQ
jgi:recombinational DNA repair ATPase RecF